MSKVNYPESYQPSFQISPQLDTLIHQMGVENMRDTVDPEISNEEIDDLLNNIEIESGRKKYLMEIVRSILHKDKITDPAQILNVKIQVLLDNLAKKLCRCSEKDRYTVGSEAGTVSRNKEGLCRSSIFQGRNIDYITHDCGNPPVDRADYKYGMGPLLKPSIRSDSNVILRRHTKKEKAPERKEKEPKEKEPKEKAPVEKLEMKTLEAATSRSDLKKCTINSGTGRCILGEPDMADKCKYNRETNRCNKL
jgi:hypothetical protein